MANTITLNLQAKKSFIPVDEDTVLSNMIDYGECHIQVPKILNGINIDEVFAQSYIDFVMDGDLLPLHSHLANVKNRVMANKLNEFLGVQLDISAISTPWMTNLYFANTNLGRMATNDIMRRHILLNKKVFQSDLIKLTDGVHSEEYCVFKSEDHIISEIDLNNAGFLKSSHVSDSDEIPFANWESLRETCMNLLQLCGDIPWYNGQCGLVVAGGRMVAGLYNNKDALDIQDVDFFVIADSPDEAEYISHQALMQWHSMYGKNNVKSSLRQHVIDVAIKSGKSTISFQIVKRVYSTPAHVIHGFDIDVCCMLFDGHAVYATPNAARAIANGFNLYDENKLSKSAILRYWKYMNRYKMSTLIVGAPQRNIDDLVDSFSRAKSPQFSTEFCGNLRLSKYTDPKNCGSGIGIESMSLECMSDNLRPKHIPDLTKDEIDKLIKLTESRVVLRSAYKAYNPCSPIRLIIRKCLKLERDIMPNEEISDYDNESRKRNGLSAVLRVMYQWFEYINSRTSMNSGNSSFYIPINKVFTGAFNPIKTDTLAGLLEFFESFED